MPTLEALKKLFEEVQNSSTNAAKLEKLQKIESSLQNLDSYQKLGLDRNNTATIDKEAKKAFRDLSLAAHPDRFSLADADEQVVKKAGEVYKQINEAYGNVNTLEARAKYHNKEDIARVNAKPGAAGSQRSPQQQTGSAGGPGVTPTAAPTPTPIAQLSPAEMIRRRQEYLHALTAVTKLAADKKLNLDMNWVQQQNLQGLAQLTQIANFFCGPTNRYESGAAPLPLKAPKGKWGEIEAPQQQVTPQQVIPRLTLATVDEKRVTLSTPGALAEQEQEQQSKKPHKPDFGGAAQTSGGYTLKQGVEEYLEAAKAANLAIGVDFDIEMHRDPETGAQAAVFAAKTPQAQQMQQELFAKWEGEKKITRGTDVPEWLTKAMAGKTSAETLDAPAASGAPKPRGFNAGVPRLEK